MFPSAQEKAAPDVLMFSRYLFHKCKNFRQQKLKFLISEDFFIYIFNNFKI